MKHFDSPQTQISEVKIAQLSPEHRLEIEQSKAERSKNHDAFAKALFQLLQKKAYPFEKMAVITDAKRNTLDSMGRPREKSSTLIYMEILKNWPEIESQTGPKELCHFLTPLLGNKSGIANQERVKKIVQRMGIVFRPKLSIGNQGTS